jgi:hypothetical protein
LRKALSHAYVKEDGLHFEVRPNEKVLRVLTRLHPDKCFFFNKE